METLQQAIDRMTIQTTGPGFYNISDKVGGWLLQNRARDGLLTVFIRHTSASLVIQENADSDVQRDLMQRLNVLAPEDADYWHKSEGPDDMPAHIKTMLTETSLSIPIQRDRMVLGTWQGLYIVEHRARPHRRELVLHFNGKVRSDERTTNEA
jgi:secondary thiamine-phosphate synthase enzyme